MKYYIQRQLNEYGPYTLADLQRYVAQGSILLTDLARSEGMTDWVPVSQVLGNIPIPVPGPPTQPGVPAYGGTVYGGPGTVYSGSATQPMAGQGPIPVDFHWALVLLLLVVTCGIFGWVWIFVEAVYVKKIKPESKAVVLAIVACAVAFLGGFVNGFTKAMNGEPNPIGGLFSLAGIVLVIILLFQMKSDLEDYYNTVEPINLQLSGVMTFFFGIFYFQHHLSRIAQWKKSGVLQPQG
jgi:GYF domain 2